MWGGIAGWVGRMIQVSTSMCACGGGGRGARGTGGEASSAGVRVYVCGEGARDAEAWWSVVYVGGGARDAESWWGAGHGMGVGVLGGGHTGGVGVLGGARRYEVVRILAGARIGLGFWCVGDRVVTGAYGVPSPSALPPPVT